MFIEDLSTYAYFHGGPNVRAIGWLETGHRYREGSVDLAVVECLRTHLSKAYQPLYFMGVHTCSLCQTNPRRRGSLNLLVPSTQLLFVAPELILHYVEDHNYCPPVEFQEALLNCPEQESSEYMDLVAEFGRPWEHGNQEM